MIWIVCSRIIKGAPCCLLFLLSQSPEKLQRLERLSGSLRYCWNAEVFVRLSKMPEYHKVNLCMNMINDARSLRFSMLFILEKREHICQLLNIICRRYTRHTSFISPRDLIQIWNEENIPEVGSIIIIHGQSQAQSFTWKILITLE